MFWRYFKEVAKIKNEVKIISVQLLLLRPN